MSEKLSKDLIQDRICQMIYRAETFIKWAVLLFNLYEKESEKYKDNLEKMNEYNKDAITSCMVLHHVLYFQEAVLVLNTLFEKKSKPSEISFSYYFLNLEKSELGLKFDNIRKEYDKTNLAKVRNVLIAHKKIEVIGDPEIGFFNPFNEDIVEEANLIVFKLKTLVRDYFKGASYNFFESLYRPAFEAFYNNCEKYLNKLIL